MLLPMQINMLKHAASISMKYIVQIYKVSLQHNDFDTADYILEHYYDKFTKEQHKEIREFIFKHAPAELLASITISKAAS